MSHSCPYELERAMTWHRGGKIAAQVMMETITRACVPCVEAYKVIEASVHKIASIKHVNPMQSHYDQRKHKRANVGSQ